MAAKMAYAISDHRQLGTQTYKQYAKVAVIVVPNPVGTRVERRSLSITFRKLKHRRKYNDTRKCS
jgi:hypothetical protein